MSQLDIRSALRAEPDEIIVKIADYVLNKERLKSVLPNQIKYFCQDELNQTYNSYFPRQVNTIDDLLRLARIKSSEIGQMKFVDEESIRVPEINTKFVKKFPKIKKIRML